MPTPKLFAAYPEEYKDLFFSACRGRMIVSLGKPSEAKRLRARLYAYRAALMAEPDLAPELALIAPVVKFSIESGDLVLYIPKEKDND